MKSVYLPGVCDHRGFITKDLICSSSEGDSVNAHTIFFTISLGHFK